MVSSFFSIVNYLYELKLKKKLQEKVYAIYIPPLRALIYDVQINVNFMINNIAQYLEQDLSDITWLFFVELVIPNLKPKLF